MGLIPARLAGQAAGGPASWPTSDSRGRIRIQAAESPAEDP